MLTRILEFTVTSEHGRNQCAFDRNGVEMKTPGDSKRTSEYFPLRLFNVISGGAAMMKSLGDVSRG